MSVVPASSRKIRFPPDKFVTIPDVVVFAEHRATLRDRAPVTYDRPAFEKHRQLQPSH